MLVGDLIYNDYLNLDCTYRVYDCTNLDNPILVYDVIQNGNRKPFDKILDLHISGITVADDNTLLILAERNN